MIINPFMFGAPPVPWTPAEVTTTAWYDADDADTITSSGGLVSVWADKSGNSRDASQGSGSNQPDYTTLGGLPVLSFDSNDYFAVSYNPSGNLSIYVVVANNRASLGASQVDVVLANTYGGNNGVSMHTYNGYSDTTKRLFYVQGSGATGQVNYIDGVETESGEAVLTYQTPNILGTIGNLLSGTGNMKIGRTQNENQYCNNLIHEIVMASGQDSEASRQRMEGYLAHKWGLTGSLPSGHPYKTTPPYV